jgi:hypothetical protein
MLVGFEIIRSDPEEMFLTPMYQNLMSNSARDLMGFQVRKKVLHKSKNRFELYLVIVMEEKMTPLILNRC